ncbi:serine hydrolase [Nocardioides sp. L-11A]|uniref:serine hydrolase domain-containing protein n=1 Tax=Nocardioides sp. L-11A TaxID=3043848 RepID=UPI00249B4C44|nr:serine hydrolase [Nocardioides sp. L-11A]
MARRILIGLLVAVVVVVGGAYAGTALLGVVPPHTLLRIQTTEPSRWGDLFPARTVEAAPGDRTAPAAAPPAGEVPWKGRTVPVREFLTSTDTVAFVVVRDGQVTQEWYADDVDPGTRLSSWSVAKSFVSLLVGQAIGRGELAEDDRLVELLPELEAGTAYDEVTVRDLLDMTAGIDVPEDYNAYWPFTGTARMYITRDLPEFVADHREVDSRPGTEGVYRSVDTELLGLILEQVTGRHLADLLETDLWQPIGAAADATWSLDREDGREKAFCCINATARDYARIGQLVLDGGRVGDRQVVPQEWITRISTPAPLPVDDWGYAAQWWHPTGGDGSDLSAIGIYGQYIYVSPRTGTVVVKLSDYGTEQDEQETIDAFRAIAEG